VGYGADLLFTGHFSSGKFAVFLIKSNELTCWTDLVCRIIFITMFSRSTLIYAIFLSSVSIVFSSNPDTTEKILETGYIFPTCDSLGIVLFVDGVEVGKSPLGHPIPVLAGFHEVGYAPPNIVDEYVKARLHQAIKRVYVPIGDTVNVILHFDQEYTQFRALRTEHSITQYIGMMMTISAAYLFWRISG